MRFSKLSVNVLSFILALCISGLIFFILEVTEKRKVQIFGEKYYMNLEVKSLEEDLKPGDKISIIFMKENKEFFIKKIEIINEKELEAINIKNDDKNVIKFYEKIPGLKGKIRVIEAGAK